MVDAQRIQCAVVSFDIEAMLDGCLHYLLHDGGAAGTGTSLDQDTTVEVAHDGCQVVDRPLGAIALANR